MIWFRIFYKEYDHGPEKKTDGMVEFQAKNISAGMSKAVKIGKRKGCRVAMIAEINKPSGLPDKL